MKRSKLFLSLSALPIVAMSLVSCQSNLRGKYVFMHKQSGNAYGESVFSGVSTYLGSDMVKDKSPSEQAVANQIQMLETCCMMGAKAAIVSSSGNTGYDNALKRITEKGMKIVSVDSPISAKYRTLHVDHCDPKAVGAFLAKSAALIAASEQLGDNQYLDGYSHEVEGSIDTQTKNAVTACKNASKKFKIGVITSFSSSPSQVEWIDYMTEELKVDPKGIGYNSVIENLNNFQILPGNDESVKSTEAANTFISQGVDMIINVTSVAAAACGEALNSHYNKTGDRHIKMTSLGMPSEMWTYMPDSNEGADIVKMMGTDKKEVSHPRKYWSESTNPIEHGIKPGPLCFPCPLQMLWSVPDMGYVAAQVAKYAVEHPDWKPTTDEEIEALDLKLMDGTELTGDREKIYSTGDGGYKLIPLDPLPTYAKNIADWKGKV